MAIKVIKEKKSELKKEKKEEEKELSPIQKYWKDVKAGKIKRKGWKDGKPLSLREKELKKELSSQTKIEPKKSPLNKEVKEISEKIEKLGEENIEKKHLIVGKTENKTETAEKTEKTEKTEETEETKAEDKEIELKLPKIPFVYIIGLVIVIVMFWIISKKLNKRKLDKEEYYTEQPEIKKKQKYRLLKINKEGDTIKVPVTK